MARIAERIPDRDIEDHAIGSVMCEQMLQEALCTNLLSGNDKVVLLQVVQGTRLIDIAADFGVSHQAIQEAKYRIQKVFRLLGYDGGG